MTYAVSTSEIKRRYDAGGSMAQISRDLAVPLETVRYRLKQAGYTPRSRRRSVTKDSVRRLQAQLPELVSLQQFLEADRRELLAWMGDNPPRDKLERLALLTDFIATLAEVTK